MRDTLGVLLAGGAGERLFPLTRDRAKPAVPSLDSTASSISPSPIASTPTSDTSTSSPSTKPSRSIATSAKAGVP